MAGEDYKPLAMKAIEEALRDEIKLAGREVGTRWYRVVSDEVERLMPTILAAPEMLKLLERASVEMIGWTAHHTLARDINALIQRVKGGDSDA